MHIIQNNLCIIPARGGSKRIPRKNVKGFLGKPIIAYSIEAAINSGLFSEVMVSTDDEEIATVARKYGASIPFYRSEKTSDDYSTLKDVVEEVKEYYSKNDVTFDNICCILATAPFVNKSIIQRVLNDMIANGLDSNRPIIKFSYPPQRGVYLKDNRISFYYPEFSNARSQDLEPIYYDAGMFYWMKFESVFTNENKGGYIIPEMMAQDIDTIEDWELAEIKYKLLNK